MTHFQHEDFTEHHSQCSAKPAMRVPDQPDPNACCVPSPWALDAHHLQQHWAARGASPPSLSSSPCTARAKAPGSAGQEGVS